MLAIAAISSVRRPAWSERVASVNNARIVPTVYAAKISVVVSAPNPSLGAHSMYSGIGRVPPSISAAKMSPSSDSAA
jgi:hypothetical protein